jgi:ribosomal protein L37AE/L43A
MGSNLSSHSTTNFDELDKPSSPQITAKGIDIASRIDRGEQECPNCQKKDGMSYIQRENLYIFECSLCQGVQKRK